jgi:hypothetical protein
MLLCCWHSCIRDDPNGVQHETPSDGKEKDVGAR